jgi:hypothetical protein
MKLRRKLEAGPEYRQIAHDSQKRWREAHPDYLPRYRSQHPEGNERNRVRQQRRDQKRRIRRLEKNNLASLYLRTTWLQHPDSYECLKRTTLWLSCGLGEGHSRLRCKVRESNTVQLKAVGVKLNGG